MAAKVRTEFERKLEQGDLEGALRVLRDGGYSKVRSIMALRDTGRYSSADAKTLVHESPVWKDVHDRDELFHADLEAELRELDTEVERDEGSQDIDLREEL